LYRYSQFRWQFFSNKFYKTKTIISNTIAIVIKFVKPFFLKWRNHLYSAWTLQSQVYHHYSIQCMFALSKSIWKLFFNLKMVLREYLDLTFTYKVLQEKFIIVSYYFILLLSTKPNFIQHLIILKNKQNIF